MMMGDLISRETAVAILRAKADMTIGEVKDAASFFDHCANMIEKLPAVDAKIDGNTSDGYHTFNELYHHRAVLFSVIVKAFPERAWKSRKHHDGTMYDGMFIVGIDTPQGQATYHYDVDPYWEMFACRELDRAPEWDGHTPTEAIARIGALEPVRHGKWIAADGMLPPGYRGKKYCSVCFEFALHDCFGRERLSWYCPFCGAIMEGGER
jgi:hypothetical protein